MLYQPKNDRVLFAFFGVSLTSRKRSRVTEIRATVASKNKLYRIFGGGNEFTENVLMRDTNDAFYPRSEKYSDFDKKPRWKEFVACAHYPEGILFHIREHFAFVDRRKREWDFIPMVNLVYRSVRDDKDEMEAAERHTRARDFWEHLPLENQGKYIIDGAILYSDFDLIDKEGDAKYKMPHLFVDFGTSGPFAGCRTFIARNADEYITLDDYKQISLFPKNPPRPRFAKVYKDAQLQIPEYLVHRLQNGQHTYFDIDGKYEFLKQRDVISIPNRDARRDNLKSFTEITYQRSLKASELIAADQRFEWEIKQQISREIDPEEEVNALQLKQVYDFQLEQRDPSEDSRGSQ